MGVSSGGGTSKKQSERAGHAFENESEVEIHSEDKKHSHPLPLGRSKEKMSYSKDGKARTKIGEWCELKAYPDDNGTPTIGWGHTHGVKLGMTCTQEQADEWLREDIADSVAAVNKYITVPLTQEQFDALVDLVFNCGPGAVHGSHLQRLLNEGDYNGAADEFPKWNHSGGKVDPGLTKRRQQERERFLSGTEGGADENDADGGAEDEDDDVSDDTVTEEAPAARFPLQDNSKQGKIRSRVVRRKSRQVIKSRNRRRTPAAR